MGCNQRRMARGRAAAERTEQERLQRNPVTGIDYCLAADLSSCQKKPPGSLAYGSPGGAKVSTQTRHGPSEWPCTATPSQKFMKEKSPGAQTRRLLQPQHRDRR